MEKFENRRKNVWRNFLKELNSKYPLTAIPKQDRYKVLYLLKKGSELQQQLDENYLDGGYNWYMKKMNGYIHIQDLVMNDLEYLQKGLFKYYNEELKKCK